jgi:cytochrome P450
MSTQEHEIANLFLKKALQFQTLVLTFFAVIVVTLVYIWWHHPLYGKNKGPKVYPIIGSTMQVLWQRDILLDYMTDHLKNQSTMTIRMVWPGGMCWHITANPDNVEYILKTNFENYPKGIIMRRHFSDFLGEGIFNANGDEWKVQRKVASHEFTSKSLRNFMHGTIQAELNHRLVPLLAKICNEGASIDLQDLFMRFAFDSICKLGFGVDPACLDFSLPNVKFAQAFDIATSLTSARFRSFPFILRLQRALNVGNERRIREAVRQIDDFAISVIQTRRKQLMEIASGRTTLESLEDQHMDLLSRFMGPPAQEKERSVEHEDKNQKQEAFSDRFLRDIVISFILAGRDTTSAGLSWFFWLLSCNRHVEGTIRAEIAKIVKFRVHVDSKEGRDNPSTSFTYEELKQMHYLHAAVTESLRLYPPVPLDGKMALEDDVLPDGTRIPKRTGVMYHPYAMGRMEKLWGADCLEFKPERWLKDGVFVPESPYKFAVFHAGPRVCLGKDFAMLQMKLVAAGLLTQFTFSVPENFKPSYALSLTMPIKNGLPVRVHPRAQK